MQGDPESAENMFSAIVKLLAPFLLVLNAASSVTVSFSNETDADGFYAKDWIFVNATCDSNETEAVLLLWNGANLSFQGNESGSYWSNMTNLSDGNYVFSAFCNTTSNESAETAPRNITIDMMAPQVYFNSPPTPDDGSWFNQQNSAELIINATCGDPLGLPASGWGGAWDNPTLYWSADDSFSSADNAPDESSTYRWTLYSLGDGNYSYYVMCTDNAGNENSTGWRSFAIDSVADTTYFDIGTETNDSYLNRNWIFANVSVLADPLGAPANISVQIWNETAVLSENSSGNVSEPLQLNATNLTDGRYYFNATEIDEAGNAAATEIWTVVIDTTQPSVSFAPNNDGTAIYERRNVLVNVSCTDSSNRTAYLNWNGANENLDSGGGDYFWKAKTGLQNGEHTYYAVCTDQAGNRAQTGSMNATINATDPNLPVSSSGGGGFSGAPVSSKPLERKQLAAAPSPKKRTSPSYVPIATPAPSASADDSLFDIVVQMMKKEIAPSENPVAKISLTKFNKPGLITVRMLYEIRDGLGNAIYSEEETRSIEVTEDFLKSLDDHGLPEGNYELYAKITYAGGRIAEAEDSFIVAGRRGKAGVSASIDQFVPYILGIFAAMAFMYGWQFRK